MIYNILQIISWGDIFIEMLLLETRDFLAGGIGKCTHDSLMEV